MIALVKRGLFRSTAAMLALFPFLAVTVIPQQAIARSVLVKVYPLKKRDAKLAALLQAMMRMNLAKLARTKVAMPGPFRLGASGKDALNGVKRGFSLLREKKYIEADMIFTKAVNGLRADLGIVEPSDLARAFLGLGITKAMNGDKDAGLEAVKKALLIDPAVATQVSGLSSKALGLIGKAKTEIFTANKGRLSVSTKPDTAEAYVRGRLVGVTPVSNIKVPQGSHYIRILRDGYKPSGVLALVGDSTKRTISLTPSDNIKTYTRSGKRLVRFLAARRVRPGAPHLRKLKTFHLADDVIAFSAKRVGNSIVFRGLHLHGSKTVKASFTLSLDATRHKQIQKYLGRLLGTSVVQSNVVSVTPRRGPTPTGPGVTPKGVVNRTPGPTLAPDTDPTLIDPNNPLIRVDQDLKRKPSIVKKWWFWTIIGVAVAGGVTAAILLTRQKDTTQNNTGGLIIKFN